MFMSHPTVETLLEDTRGDRPAARQMLVDRCVEYAKAQATLLGLSSRCEVDVQLGVPLVAHRCANDGSNCLCACHDPGAR